MSKSKKQMKAPQSQWLIMFSDKVWKDGVDNRLCPSFIKLQHPKSGDGALFLISSEGSTVFEVMRFNEKPRSWLIEDTVQQDGSLFITTPMDPLFLAIPYLQRTSTKFMPLDQILIDEKYPHLSQLWSAFNTNQLSKICDCKQNGELHFARINEEKLMKWLNNKVERTACRLTSSDVKVTCGSQSATFVRSKKTSNLTRDDYIRYSFGLVSDYISTSLSTKLHNFMGIPEKPKEPVISEEPPAKKAKLSENSVPDEDYMNGNIVQQDKAKATPRLTLAQKQLAKVDKKGMKSISSFFSGKAKKK